MNPTHRFSSERQILSYFVAVVLIVSGIILISMRFREKSNRYREGVNRSQEVLTQTDTLLVQQKDVVLAVRGYVMTGNQVFLDGYEAKEAALDSGLHRLKELLKENADRKRYWIRCPLFLLLTGRSGSRRLPEAVLRDRRGW